MKMHLLTLLLVAGMLLLGCGACSSQATPAAISEPTEGVAMASASPTPEEIIQVTIVEPVSRVIRMTPTTLITAVAQKNGVNPWVRLLKCKRAWLLVAKLPQRMGKRLPSRKSAAPS